MENVVVVNYSNGLNGTHKSRFFYFAQIFVTKIMAYYLGFQNERHKMAQIPCDISARSWGGTEICDSREAFGGGEGMLILVSEEW